MSTKHRLLLQLLGVFLMFTASFIIINPEDFVVSIPKEYSFLVSLVVIIIGAFIVWKFRRYK